MPATIFSFLLQHLLILLVIFWLAIGYLYRGAIFGLQPAVTQQPAKPAIKTSQPVADTQPKKFVAEKPHKDLLIRPNSASSNPDFAFRKDPPYALVAPTSELAMLQAARKSYWSGDKQRALEQYARGLNKYPTSIELLGEIGNLYYEKADVAQALRYWEQLPPLLKRQGQRQKASELDRFISDLSLSLESGS